MRIEDLKINLARVEAGDWVDVDDLPGLRLKVRGIDNSDFRKQRELQLGRWLRRGTSVPETKRAEITTRLLVDTVLLDWTGLEGDDGEPLAYSREQAEKLLFDPAMDALRSAVILAATRIATPPALA